MSSLVAVMTMRDERRGSLLVNKKSQNDGKAVSIQLGRYKKPPIPSSYSVSMGQITPFAITFLSRVRLFYELYRTNTENASRIHFDSKHLKEL